MSSRNAWTPARDALLRELVAVGKSRRNCMEPLSALPGPPLRNVYQIRNRIQRLGLLLSEEHIREELRVASLSRTRFGGRASSITPERLAYMQVAYQGGVDLEVMRCVLNGMYGPDIPTTKALLAQIRRRRITRDRADPDAELIAAQKGRKKEAANLARRIQREAAQAQKQATPRLPKPPAPPKPRHVAPPPPPPAVHASAPVVQPSAEIAEAVTLARYEGARMALTKRKADHSEIARRFRLQLWQVYRIVGEMRREQMGARA